MSISTAAALGLTTLLLAVSGSFAQTADGDSLPGAPEPAESTAAFADTTSAQPLPKPLVSLDMGSISRAWKSPDDATLSHGTLLELASCSPVEAFVTDAGIHVVREGWYGMPEYLVVEGGGSDEIVYLMDGVPFSDNQLEVLDLSRLPLAGLERAQVMKGGLASVVGSGAIAGVWEITSMTAMPESPESEITAWWGSHDARAVSTRFSRRLTDRLGVLGTYENMSYGGWIDDTSSKADKFSGKVTAFPLDKTRLELIGFKNRGDFDWPDSCPTSFGTSSASRGRDRDFVKASLLCGDRRRFRVHYYRLGLSESYSSPETSYVHDGTLHGFEIGVSLLAADSAVTDVGMGYKIRHLASSSLGNRSSHDLYVGALKERRWDGWRIQGSIRLAKNSDFDAQAGLGLSACYVPRRGVRLFGRLDRGYGFPGYYILYADGKDRPLDSRIGPETSIGIELGGTVQKGPVSLSVSVFHRNMAGRAGFATDDSCRTYLDPDMDAATTGSEVSLRLILRPWLDAALSCGICSMEGDDGEKPAHFPGEAIAASASLTRELSPHVSAGITLAGGYVSSIDAGARLEPCGSYAACLHGAELPEYVSGLVDVHLDIDRATVFLRVQNITNSDITTDWGRPPLPARSYEVGISALLMD
jgi:hypothetical protein